MYGQCIARFEMILLKVGYYAIFYANLITCGGVIEKQSAEGDEHVLVVHETVEVGFRFEIV